MIVVTHFTCDNCNFFCFFTWIMRTRSGLPNPCKHLARSSWTLRPTNSFSIPFVDVERLGDFHNLKYDLLIIDTPPYLMDTLRDLFLISDFVLVPSKVGFFDVLAIRSTLEILRSVEKQKPALKYGVVLNMLKSRTSITEEIVKLLEDYDAPMLKTNQITL